MKKKIFYSILIMSGLLSSCKDDFLDQTPISEIATSDFYQTEGQVGQALVGTYNQLLTFPSIYHVYLSEIRSKNFYTPLPDAQRDYYEISAFSATPALPTLETAWANSYRLINRANEIIIRIDPITFSTETLKKQYKAEAKFLRAYTYFELVRAFGGVPIIERPLEAAEVLTIPRSSAADVYNFIIKDLTEAIPDLPASYPTSLKGRATTWAARGILAKVYLTMAGYPLQQAGYLNDAKVLLQQIREQEGKNVFWAPTYKELFNSNNDNRYYIFEVQYISGGQGLGNLVPGEGLPVDISRSIAEYGAYYVAGEPSQDLIDSYEANDVRKEATISTSYVNTGNRTINRNLFTKFLEPGKDISSSSDWPINFPILRYADVLLMYAEILNEQAGSPPLEAINILNRIRQRAGLNNINPATQEAFREALQQERRHEFAWEGIYWHDLVRTNRAVPVMNGWLPAVYNKTIDQNQLIYPIPRSEMLIYPGLYEQNPGYN